jgi:hypothetical protein
MPGQAEHHGGQNRGNKTTSTRTDFFGQRIFPAFSAILLDILWGGSILAFVRNTQALD